MTGDAQAEAERIVGEIVANETAVLPWVKDIDAWHEHQERVVVALAAAIDHVTANDDVPDDYSVGAWDMDADTFRALRDALSALRARAEEETG